MCIKNKRKWLKKTCDFGSNAETRVLGAKKISTVVDTRVLFIYISVLGAKKISTVVDEGKEIAFIEVLGAKKISTVVDDLLSSSCCPSVLGAKKISTVVDYIRSVFPGLFWGLKKFLLL